MGWWMPRISPSPTPITSLVGTNGDCIPHVCPAQLAEGLAYLRLSTGSSEYAIGEAERTLNRVLQ